MTLTAPTDPAQCDPRAAPDVRRRTMVVNVAAVGWVVLLAGLLAIVLPRRPEAIDAIDPLRRWAGLLLGGWIVATFTLAQCAIGALIVDAIRLPVRTRRLTLLRIVLFFVAGSFASYAMLLIGVAVRLPGSLMIWSYTIIAAIAVAYGFVRLKRLINCSCADPVRRRRSGRMRGILAIIAIVVWALPFVLQAILPNHDWDGAAYHLPVARELFRANFWSIDPIFWWGALPSGLQLFYGLFIAWHAPQAIIPFNLLLGAMSIPVVGATARQLAGRRAGLLAMLVYASQNLVWEVGITPRTDTAATFFFAVALFAMVSWLRHRRQGGWLIIFGLSLGWMLGLRQTSFVFAGIAGLVLIAMALIRARRLPRQAWIAGAIGIGLVIVPSSLWYVRNWVAVGDPVYPAWKGEAAYGADGRVVRYAELSAFVRDNLPRPRVVGGMVTGTPFERAAVSSIPVGPRVPPLTEFWDTLTAPKRHERKPLHALNLLLAPALLVLLVRRDAPATALLIIAVAGWIAMGLHTDNARYVLPTAPALSVLSAIVLLHQRVAWLGLLAMAGLIVWRAPQIANHSDISITLIEPVLWRVPSLVQNMSGSIDADAPTLMREAVGRIVHVGGIVFIVMLGVVALIVGKRGRRAGHRLAPASRVAFALAILALGLNAVLEYHKLVTFVEPQRYLLAQESELQFLMRVGYNRAAAVPRLIRAMLRMEREGRMTFDGRLVQIAATPAGDLPMTYIPDGTFTGRRWGQEFMRAGSLDAYVADLRRRDVKYVLVNLGTIMWGGHNSAYERDESMFNLAMMADFWRRYAEREPLYEQEDLLLLELKPVSK